MKKIFFCLLVVFGKMVVYSQISGGMMNVQNQPVLPGFQPDMVNVVRWISPVTRDFETLREDLHPDDKLTSWGYKTKVFQFKAYANRPPGSNATAVYRWVMPHCAASILIAEHEHSDAQMQAWGYKDKQFMFYAYRTRPTLGNYLEVNRWINAKPAGDPCRDFTLTVTEKEYTDQQLISYGYTQKITQFYVLDVDAGSPASGDGQTVTLQDIDEWLCPNNLTRGDREFDGHGPRIKTEVRLRVAGGGTALYADITFWAQETQHDWSTAEGRWTRKVYDAPYGKKIRRVVSDQASRTQFISPPGGWQFGFPGHDVSGAVNAFLDGVGGGIANAVFALHGLPAGDLTALGRLVSASVNSGNTAVRVPATEGTLVKFFTIVGDTGGPDISHDDNCNDDTRIVKIEFAPVRVEWEN